MSIQHVRSGQIAKRTAETVDPKTMTEFQRRRQLTLEARKKEYIKARDRDMEEVVGIFKNQESPGQYLEFSLKLYDEPIHSYHLEDGETYRVPRGTARHLNNNCYYKEYKMLPGLAGEKGIRTGAYNSDGRLAQATDMLMHRKVHRFAFHSMEFMDEQLQQEMTPSNIVEVTRV